MSSSKRTKHIKSKYFFIKDKVEQGEIEIRKKDTDDMWCDVCTKPKQGKPFRKDRAMIMNCPMDWPDEAAGGKIELPMCSNTGGGGYKLQECVGDSVSPSGWAVAASAA